MITYLKYLFSTNKEKLRSNDDVKSLLAFDLIIVDGYTGAGKTYLAEKIRRLSENKFHVFEEYQCLPSDFYQIGDLLARNIPCIFVVSHLAGITELPYPIRNVLRAHTLKKALVRLTEKRKYSCKLL